MNELGNTSVDGANVTVPLIDLPKHRLRAAVLEPFVKRYRLEREILRLDPDLALAFRHAVTTPDGLFFYLRNSKTGCTTISQMLHGYAFGRPFDGDIHHSRDLPQGIRHWRLHRRALDDGGAIKFSFVRHPVGRLRSAFFDFFVDCKNDARHRHWDNMVQLGFSPAGDITRNFDVFLDYVALNLERSERHCDQHWRPQWICLGSGKIAYDFIGRMENFDDDVARLFSRAGIMSLVEKTRRMLPYNRSSNSARGDLHVRPDQLRKIRALYATDFETFGYDRQSDSADRRIGSYA